MNVRLQYDLEFLGGIYFEDQLQMNQYSVSLNLVTGTADPADTNTAMDRVKAFVFGELEHSVFMNSAQRERAELMHMMGINVTTLPEEPVDQIIGMMLYYKLNAIMEGRMIVRSLDISSTLGDSVWYQHDDEDPSGPFTQDGWWHDSTVKHNTVDFAESDENVLKVEPNAWVDYGLLWPNEQPLTAATAAGNTVVFGNFPKMKTDAVGQIVLNESDLIDMIMCDRDLESISEAMIVDGSVDLEAAAFWLEYVPAFTYWTEPLNQESFDAIQQQHWHMPDRYKQLDIAEYVLKLCKTDAELQRCGHELMLYQERGLFDLLRFLTYLVDIMRENHVIWGVGRGSSVSSYVLYKLGIHRIDSMFYDLDVEEFLR